MKENMDQLEEKLREEFERFAREEEKALRKSGGFIMPEGKKEKLYTAIRGKAGKKSVGMDKEEQSVYAGGMYGDREEQSAYAGEMYGDREEQSAYAGGMYEDREEQGAYAGGMYEDREDEIDWADRGDLAVMDADMSVPGGRIKERNLYAELSEEDWRALELGRKLMEQEVHEEFRVKALKKKRKKRRLMYVGVAAVLVMVLGIGVTSMGGAERIIKMVSQMVGGRQVKKATFSDDIKPEVRENEEEAYQKVSEKLGVEPVRILYKSKILKFIKIEFDEKIKTAELFYEYDGKAIIYLINASYSETAWGLDMEDKIVDTTEEEINGCKMEIEEYYVSETKTKKYSASFEYRGLEYYLIGDVEKENFYDILNSLFFYNISR